MFKISFLLALICMFLVSSCQDSILKGDIKVSIKGNKPVITKVKVENHQLIITGAYLEEVNLAKIEGPTNHIFSIESKTSNKIVLNAKSFLSLLANKSMNLIVSNAYGAATFPISFQLQDGQVTAQKLHHMGASSGQFLQFNGTTWVPSSISTSQVFAGGYDAATDSPDIVTIGGATGTYYIVTVGGTQNLGAGSVTLEVGDWVIFNGTFWERLAVGTNTVSRFNNRTGLVVPMNGDYSWSMLDKTAGKLTGSKVQDIADVDTVGIQDKDILLWNQSSTKWEVGPLPVFTIAAGSVTNSHIANGSIDSTKISDGSIVNADISATAAIDQSKISGLTVALDSKEPQIISGTVAQYWRGNKTWSSLQADVQSLVLNSYVVGTNTALSNSDSLSGALGKIQGQINALGTADIGKEPTINTGATTQYYRGDKTWQTLNGAVVTNTPAGNIAATTTQLAINELDSEKQGLITATSALNVGSVTTNLQNGLNINPFGAGAGNTGEIRLYELGGANYISIKSPDALAANINYVMPSVAPTAGQVLSSSAAGVMSWINPPSAPVSTVFGRSGAVVAVAGDYTATHVTNSPAGNISSTNVQAALNELDAEKQSSIMAGTTAQYYRGDKSWQTLNTTAVPEGTNAYFTNARVMAAPINGYTIGTATSLNISDSLLQALGKLEAMVVAFATQWSKNGSSVYYNSGNVGLGTAAPGAQLHVAGTVKLEDGNQQNGYQLTSDAAGNATWQKPKVWGQVCATGQYLMGYDNNGNKVCGSTLVGFADSPQSGGGSHQCAIMTDSTVACWGYNYTGQLGNNTVASQNIGTFVRKADGSKLASVTSLSLSWANSCAVSNGEVYCWGDNAYYQGGLGNVSDTWLAARVPGITTAVQIASGVYHTCARLADGRVMCWGLNDNGQIGINTLVTQTTPAFVLDTTGSGQLTGVSDITAGSKHTCAIKNGGVLCWGDNAYGMIGDGTLVDRKIPTATTGMPSGVMDVAAALAYYNDGTTSTWRSNTCAVKTDGTVWCWGRCAERQCGYSATPGANLTSPVQVLTDDNKDGTADGPLTGAVEVTLGALQACAIKSDGTARCWGMNVGGSLGDATTLHRFFGVPVSGVGGAGTLTNIKGISITGQYNNGTNVSAIAILNDGNAVGWGANNRGQIGDNSVTARTAPVGLVQP